MRAEPSPLACTVACRHHQPHIPCTAISPSAASFSPMRSYETPTPACLWPTPFPRNGPSPVTVPGQSPVSIAGRPWRCPPASATATSTHPRRQSPRRRGVICTTVWLRVPSLLPLPPGMPRTSPVTRPAKKKRDPLQRMK